ncbi:hypothetical protein PPERSA_07826 [Pseudocohnilembus persalinus]|uniref:Protein YIPF n=1 Tax=Pseudocohnilembus persalinus TaxID=266149 RepID=A0A0V0QBZ9_PSEPJ|nr:hypothetical protein PPERSA_07826 [Pseudocohnilembus persalinus]|eukprot:KRW99749.1 hypothetical protein PPERSA_07826 [Pseudocohnilembus persalinus]
MSGYQEKLIDKALDVLDEVDEVKQINSNQKDYKKNPPKGLTRFCKLNYWRKYFDFESTEILIRFQASIFHFPVFSDLMARQPDLYGPFWIYTTIVLFLGIAGNINGYLDNVVFGNSTYHFNYSYIPNASALVYGVGIAEPIILYIMMKIFNSPLLLMQTICLYGYSLSCFIIVTPLCILPYSLLQYILLGYGLLSSSIFMIRNIRVQIMELDQNQRYGIYGLILKYGDIDINMTLNFINTNKKFIDLQQASDGEEEDLIQNMDRPLDEMVEEDLDIFVKNDDPESMTTRLILGKWNIVQSDLLELLISQAQDRLLSYYIVTLLLLLTEAPDQECKNTVQICLRHFLRIYIYYGIY